MALKMQHNCIHSCALRVARAPHSRQSGFALQALNLHMVSTPGHAEAWQTAGSTLGSGRGADAHSSPGQMTSLQLLP